MTRFTVYMAKRKWYVVTVGRSVGVYPTWVEAAPLVKGVSEAIYQGFTSEAEARRVFLQEMSKGTTRVVRSEGRPSPQTTPRQTYSEPYIGHGKSHTSYKPSMTPNPRCNEVNASPLRREQTEFNMSVHSAQHTPAKHVSSPLARSSSETPSSMRRFEIIDALFKKESDRAGVEARASRSAQASSPTKSRTTFQSPRSSPQIGVEQTPEVIVETPSWLDSYPKAQPTNPQPLSPLNMEDFPLSAFASLSLTPSVGPSSAVKSPYGNSGGSTVDSSFYMSPPSSSRQERTICHEMMIDPRSPIRSKSQVPELAFVSPLLFSRPSPSSKGTPLPANVEDSPNTPPTSLLFKPSPKSRKISINSQA